MPKKKKGHGRGLFDGLPGSDDSSPGYVSHYPRTCPLCQSKGMHYFYRDGSKPVESWCGHCSTWSRLIGGMWTKCEPGKKNAEPPGPSEQTPRREERESQ